MFKNLLQPLVEFYETREPREQFLLLLGLPMILILLVYLALWEPIFQENKKLKSQLMNEQRFTQWFQQQTTAFVKTDKAFDWNSRNLPSVVENTLEEFVLTPWKKRIFQNQRQETIVTFEKVPYKNLMQWVQKLNVDYQVVFREVLINATDTPSRVNVRLTVATTHENLE